MTKRVPLSLIDFCTIYPGETARQSMQRSVDLAQNAEKLGYSRLLGAVCPHRAHCSTYRTHPTWCRWRHAA